MTTHLEKAEAAEEEARLLQVHHKAIEALVSIEAVVAYASRINASGFPSYIADDLLHHLESKRLELLRKSGALAP